MKTSKALSFIEITLVMLSIAFCSTQAVDARERSQEAKDGFKYSNPCPSNGNNQGACPGYIIDHILPLACGGADAPSNMQWQTVREAKAKDKWERKGCKTDKSGHVTAGSGAYNIGKRGGCFIYSTSGKKKYVAHSYCGR